MSCRSLTHAQASSSRPYNVASPLYRLFKQSLLPRRFRPPGSSMRVACNSIDAGRHQLNPSSDPDTQTFVHPELLEGPLQYLPSSWFIQSSPSPSSSSNAWDRRSSSSLWDTPPPTPAPGANPQSPTCSTPPTRESLPDDEHQRLMASLRHRMLRGLGDQPATDLLEASPHALQRLGQVYVLVFRQEGSRQEGLYAVHDYAGDTVMAFELQEDAERYARLVQASMQPLHPSVLRVSADRMVGVCRELGYRCRLEPVGSETVPPQAKVRMTDWERVMNLRSGKFLVLESEPSYRRQRASSVGSSFDNGNTSGSGW